MTGVLRTGACPSDADISKIPSFLFCRWLSGSPYTVHAANQINAYSKIPITNQYKLIHTAFSGKIKYIPYPKRTAVHDDTTVEYIAEHFNINLCTAREYVNLMDPDELNELIQMYTNRDLKK